MNSSLADRLSKTKIADLISDWHKHKHVSSWSPKAETLQVIIL